MRLWGKDTQAELIRSMILNDKLCHSFILTGDEGIGKRTLAKYIAAAALCENATGVPCGQCRSCRMCEHGGHPDLIELSPTGKSDNFRVDDLRPVVSDASVAANEGGYKVYIIPEIDKALPAAQNILLKVFEEPPEHVIFIMTAQRREKVLPTILSRAVALPVYEAGRAECISALLELGASEDDASKAYDVFGGNIGKCLEYIRGEGRRALERIRGIAGAISAADEYALAKALFISDRDECLEVCAGLSELVCDVCIIKQGGTAQSCFKAEAAELGKSIRMSGAVNMYSDIAQAIDKLQKNANVTLTMCDLGARLKADSV